MKYRTLSGKPLYPAVISFALSSLAACSGNNTQLPDAAPNSSAVASERYLDKAFSPSKQSLKAGIAALTEGDAKAANQAFNAAISQDMQNAALHTANALAYQIRSRSGERDLFQLAETGFLIALEQQHDSQNAILQLTHLYLENKQYQQAQLAATYALKLDARDLESLYLLATASYYLGDAELALWAIQRARDIAPQDSLASAMTPIIYSAAGLTTQAQNLFQAEQLHFTADDQQKLSQRLGQWQASYSLSGANKSAFAPSKAELTPSVASPPLDNAAADGNSPGPLVYAWSDCVQRLTTAESEPETTTSSDSESKGVAVDETVNLPSLPSPCLGRALPKMAVIDVVILRNNELNTSTQGINLLDNLAVTMQNTSNKVTTSTTDEPTITNTTLTRDLGLGTSAGGAIAYSLNIANVTEQTTEVVARPSLLVLDRQSAQFFSGSNIAVGLAGGDSGSSSFNQINVGVSLSVTPTFIDDDHMLLNVKAARTFFEPVTGSSTFSQSIQTSRNMVSAATSVRVNETLILSGLAESEVIAGSSGVPLIKDIPGVKNVFSKTTRQAYSKSVLILITPRRVPAYDRTLQDVDQKRIKPEQPAEAIVHLRQFAHAELSEKWPDLFSKMQPMSQQERAFNARTHDIKLVDWSALPRMKNILQQATEPLNFNRIAY